jgi:fatty-acyl-CoA synthase
VLYKHPKVTAVAVVAMPDQKWGETPCAFVELDEHDAVSADALIDWCKQHMAGFKVPGHFVFDAIEKTSTGKVQKFALRERAKSILR